MITYLFVVGSDYLLYLVWAKVENNDLTVETIFFTPNPHGMEKTKPGFHLSENVRNASIVAVLFALVALISYLEWLGKK